MTWQYNDDMTVRKYIEAGVHSIDTMTYISLSLAKTYHSISS